MGTIDIPFPPSRLALCSGLALAVAMAPAPAEAKKKTRLSGAQQPDVTISETFGRKFELEKPPVNFDFPLEEFLPPSEAASPRSIPGGKDSEANKILLQALGYPESRVLAKPWLAEIPGPDYAEFQLELPRKQVFAGWELTIFDPGGKIVDTLQGPDQPPEKVRWNLKTTAGTPIQVGIPYTYSFQILGRHQKSRSYLGKSFELPALQYYAADRSRVIEIALKALFIPKKAALQPSGDDLLMRALQTVIESKASNYRFTLQDRSSPALLQKRLQALARIISRELRIQEEQVSIANSGLQGRGAVFQVEMR